MNTTEHPLEVVTQGRLIQDLVEGRSFAKMPETKIVKFLQQFPWMQQLLKPEHISEVYVSGIDPGMISRRLRFEHSDYLGDNREYAFLVDENGEVVSRTVEEIVTWRKYLFFGPKLTEKATRKITGDVAEGSTIESALMQLGEEAEKIKFILSYAEWTEVAIVYKRPKGVGIWEWVRNGIDAPTEAANQLRLL